MRNKTIFILLVFTLFLLIFLPSTFAKTLDEIEEYHITVSPQKDGSLDMEYHIKWKVLDSESEGPLEWVKIGIPNAHAKDITGITSNIKSIDYKIIDNGYYIRVDFDRAYYKNEVIDFTFSFRQEYMYNLSGDTVSYDFTPGWFDDIEVKDIEVMWDATDVRKADGGEKNSDGFYVWSKRLRKGGKMPIRVTYRKSAFTSLNE